ncbi:Spermatogenesis-defective protein 39-like [Holothuria leucospilota]|uniref:Spermatogenesis-defective protein 39-like n=1 Tax=Holothuria leucospilota TaxID=206669 RepID=A0A9Q1BQ52_HOLLE|nr:Spermatogenesis-defective protein 39-like [Holothuria leucospilota]
MARTSEDMNEDEDYWHQKQQRDDFFAEKPSAPPVKSQVKSQTRAEFQNQLKEYGLGDEPDTVDWSGNLVKSKPSAVPKRPSNPPKRSARGTVNVSSPPESTSVVNSGSVRYSKSSVSESDRISVSSNSSQQTNTSDLSHRRSASDASGKAKYTETPSPSVSADSASSIDEAIKRDGKLSISEATQLMAENVTLERKIVNLNKSRWSKLPIADTVSRIISGEKYSLEPYKSLKDKVALLDAVVGYHDGNAILVVGGGQRSFEVTRGQKVNTLEIARKHDISRRINVVIFLKRTLSRSIFYEEMRKRPDATNQYVAFLKVQQSDDVAREMDNLSRTDDAAISNNPETFFFQMWRLKKAGEDSSPEGRLSAVSKCYGWFSVMDSLDYEASMVQEFVKLLNKQLQIEPGDARAQSQGHPTFSQMPRKVTLYFQPLITTLFYVCLYHYSEPETSFSSPLAVKNEFKITEKQYLYTALRARSKAKDWDSIEALFTAKNWRGKAKFKAPMKFEKVVEVLAGINAPRHVLDKYLRLVEDTDSRMQLAQQHKCHTVVIDMLADMKDRVRLEAYRETVRNTRYENHLEIVLRRPNTKWKN